MRPPGGPGSWQRYRKARSTRVETGGDVYLIGEPPPEDLINVDPAPDPDPIFTLFDAGPVTVDLSGAPGDPADELSAEMRKQHEDAAAAATRKAWTYAAAGLALGWFLGRR